MKKIFIFFGILIFSSGLYAEKINVFVASSASKAMSEVKEEFLKAHPKDEVELIFGSSGKHYQLLKEGREFDLFFSADAKYAEQIYKDGNALSEPKVYALGVVALYALDSKFLKNGVESLKDKNFKHLSIANPKVAPYGEAAVQVLEKLGIYENLQDKIVLGDNVSQPVLYVDSGNAEVAIVAYSLVSKVNNPKGKAFIIDEKLYEPLRQSFVLTTSAKDKKLAQEFADFVGSQKGKEIIKKYGFNTP